jgi:lysyl-tRNA synthetase, class II
VWRLERHLLGPRVFVFGRRIHEWHLGMLVILASVVVAIVGPFEPVHALVGALLGAWLVVKDWPDLIPSRRDTAGWRLGLHRRPFPLRPVRRLDDMPVVAAIATAVIGIVDLVAAVTPNVSWRGRALVHVEPLGVMRAAHALAVPTSFALVLTAYYLYRRRSGAMHIALGLMIALTVFNIVKGLDIEDAVLTLSCAVLLWASRSSFYGRHEPGTIRSAALRLPLLLGGAFLTALAVVAIAAPRTVSFQEVIRETGDLLLWQPGPFGFGDELAKTGLAVELISILTLVTAAYMLLRPLTAPRDLPEAEIRRAAAELVHEHGRDTLAFFKLRADMHYLFNADRAAFVGYRIESGVMMISGDPVGDPAEIAELIRNVVAFAEEHSLRIAALGVSAVGRDVFEQAGLRALYIGDEAIVDTRQFTLEGRAIRKVRQSVLRLEKAGYRTDVADLGALDEQAILELEQVADDWRAGTAERGFSMAMDSLRNPHGAQTSIVYATDEQNVIQGFLHFVPAYGRTAVSLSFMRRRQDTPNGLTEFMIVKAIELLRGRGVTDVSLNFAAFARLIREPAGLLERIAGRLIVLGDTWFQIERLYRFNAKFFPRWEPRYFMYERRFGLPRAGIAALWLEGQLPRPPLRPDSRTPSPL